MNYADYVDPYIGTISPILQTCEPRVLRPHGMAQLVPVYDQPWTDRYWAGRLTGFALLGSKIMAKAGFDAPDVSEFDHDLETVKCYKAQTLLETSGIQAEYTATDRCAVFRFTAEEAPFVITLTGSALSVSGRDVSVSADMNGVTTYAHARFTCDIAEARRFRSGISCLVNAKSVTVYVGLSFIDAQQAAKNAVTELGCRTLDEIAGESRDIWNKALGRIEVKGGTEREKRIFYTSLYRVLNRMVRIDEYGRYYDPDSRRVYDRDIAFYTVDAIWDTFRGAHPLKLLLSPSQQADEINSFLSAYRTGGWLPSFPGYSGNHCVMFGKHAAQMITDAWMKGERGFDGNLALEAMLKNSEQATKIPWSPAPVNDYDACYEENGFFPAIGPGEKETNPYVTDNELRQSVSVTLEVSYDDWCISQMARALGKDDIADKYAKRALNYKNVFDPETGFASPRDRQGNWIKPFDPHLSEGPGGRLYFAECNSYTYSFSVQHDVEGLTQLFGGKDGLARRLDELFSEQYGCWKYVFLGKFPDSTGLIGQFCMGNEPSFHIPYLYNAAGQPWKTQKRVREIMRIYFDDTPTGVCGDEDNGAMSAWYVFSAMGFYPVCPGKPEYDLGSPVFDEVDIHLENGNTFTIKADRNLPGNKYIASARLNGERLAHPQLTHADIMRGGVLDLTMDSRPHTDCFD